MGNSYSDFARVVGTATTPTVTNGLIAWYKANAGSGSTLYDNATSYADSTAQDMSINGPSWTTTAKTGGQALDFNGAGDYTERQQIPEITTSGSYSITLWFNADAFSTDNDAAIINNTNGDTDRNAFGVTSNAEVSFTTYDGNYTTVGWGTPSTNTWYHVGCVNNSGTLTLYINGEQKDDATKNAYGADAANLRLGTDTRGNRLYFDGILDDVRVYNDVKTQSTIQNIYNNTK